MFGISLFNRLKRSNKTPKTYRPWIDRLESRVCLSTMLPHITLSSQVQTSHFVQLSGTVTGEQNNAGVGVTFSGEVTGTTMTDSSGNFSYTTNSAALGTVYAVAADTNTAQANIAVDAPALTLSIAYGTQKNVTLTGQLTDIDKAGQTITFTGVANGTAVTDSEGNFSLTTTASALGAIDAAETDLWGQAGCAEVTVSRDAPDITSFQAIGGFGTTWLFQGQVTGPNVEGLIIQFGGLPSLDGQTAVVEADGSFAFTRTLAEGENGTVTAITTDAWGQDSNQAVSGVG
jgi:hypothetical protein